MTALAPDTVLATVAISLEGGCGRGPGCRARAERHHAQLQAYAAQCSLLELDGVDAWLAQHRTARRRRGRAIARGYRFAPIDRSLYLDAIYAINTSAEERQGRPMTDGYRSRPSYGPDTVECDRHAVNCYGVLTDAGLLVAYAFVYRLGELALISGILGHADHLEGEVMYLLAAGVVEHESGQGGWLFYNRHDSGTDGLRFFKERVGFQPCDIDWRLE